MKVAIKYMFVFDPEGTWAHIDQFDQSLASYFDGIGFEAAIIKPAEGQEQVRMLEIRKKEILEPKDDQMKSKQKLNMAKMKRDERGRLSGNR